MLAVAVALLAPLLPVLLRLFVLQLAQLHLQAAVAHLQRGVLLLQTPRARLLDLHQHLHLAHVLLQLSNKNTRARASMGDKG